MTGPRDLRRPGPLSIDAFSTQCRIATAWPLPGSGKTFVRFEKLIDVSRTDLVMGRLVEAHADAVAIAAELGCPELTANGRWGVWAAGPAGNVKAEMGRDGWKLYGTKHWCSGAGLVDHVLLDAASIAGQQLFAIRLDDPGVTVLKPTWTGPGMQRSDTRSVSFDGTPAVTVGAPGAYLTRPGFWVGAVGVAACWHGGAEAVATELYRAAHDRPDPHALVHLGAVHAALFADRAILATAADRIDEAPGSDHGVLALSVRATVERNATEIIDRVGRALGPAPLAHDAIHAATVADLAVYIRQHHAEGDLWEMGRRLAGQWQDGAVLR